LGKEKREIFLKTSRNARKIHRNYFGNDFKSVVPEVVVVSVKERLCYSPKWGIRIDITLEAQRGNLSSERRLKKGFKSYFVSFEKHHKRIERRTWNHYTDHKQPRSVAIFFSALRSYGHPALNLRKRHDMRGGHCDFV
jgi:hypothetical protein